MKKSNRHEIEAPEMSDEEWRQLILTEIESLNNQINDPKNTICTHCLNLSLLERYKELGVLNEKIFRNIMC